MAPRARPPAGLLALLGACWLLLPAQAAAQSGGAPVPGPGDPCPATYPGDDAPKKSIARWMARGVALRELPEELPVMAGLAESGLRNLSTPDFAGFFGMHRSLNEGPYRGFPRNPELQLRWFADSAVAARQRAIAEGDAAYAADPSGYGVWIADVERPAPENRDGYQPYLDDAQALLGGASCRPADHVPDTQPPALRVKARSRQRDAVALTVRCPVEQCLAGAQAEPRRRVRHAAAVVVAGDPVTLTLAARTRRSTRLTVTVTAVDAAGNATRKQKRVTVLR